MIWDNFPNFSEREFKCKHTGKCNMNPVFLTVLQQIRCEYGKPMAITSGFRDPSHPVEAMKDKPGEHCYGMAADIIAFGSNAIALVQIAINHGITRIGLHQKGPSSSRFVHLGMGDKLTNDFQAGIWTY